MTYEELMNNEAIQFVVFRPSLDPHNPNGISIFKKRVVLEETIEGYTFKTISGSKNDTAEYVKENKNG